MLVVRIEHADEERDVGGVAGFDDPVENDAALATGEGDLVTIVRVAAVLADDVGVRFEDGDELLVSGDGLAVKDAPLRLRDDMLGEGKVMIQSIGQLARETCEEARVLTQWLEGLPGVSDRLPGDFEQLAVTLQALRLVLGVDDGHVASLRAPRAVSEGDPKALVCTGEDARQRLHAVEQERVVRRVVDVRFADGGIDAQLVPVLDSFDVRVAHEQMIDLLPGFAGDAFDVVRERRLAGNLERMSEAAEARVGARVGQVEGELLVAEAVHLLDEG